MSLTNTLKEAIRKTGRSMYAVSRGAGLSPPTLQHFMHGTRGVTLASADKLADYLGLELTPKQAKSKGKGK